MIRNYKFIIALLVISITSAIGQVNNEGQKVKEYLTFKNGLLAFTQNEGVYFSLDTGQTWKPVNKGLIIPGYCGKQFCNGTVAALLMNDHVYTMRDIEEGWIIRETGFTTSKKARSLGELNGSLFTSTDDGVFSSTDHGASWKLLNKLPKQRTSAIVTNSGVLLLNFYVDNQDKFYSTTDGEKWNTVSNDDLKNRSGVRIMREGDFITASWCRQEYNSNGFSDCKVNLKWVLTENGKKWQAIEVQPRGFWVSGKLIYAVNGKPVRNGNNYVYVFNILQSEDRGKSWQDVTASMEEIIGFNNSFSEKVQRIYDSQQTELADYQIVWKTVDAYSKEVKAQSRAMLNAAGGNPLKYTVPMQVYDGSKYRDASNDRFKERNNHRDTWIDSNGGLHSPK